MSTKIVAFAAGLGALAVYLGKEATAATGGPLTVDRVRSLAESTVSRYARTVDPLMIRAMVEIESARDPRAVREEVHIGDASVGLMQTLVGTARWLYDDIGDRRFSRPDFTSLLDPQTSMYFGARYVAWMKTHRRWTGTEEWLVRSYNGGPGNPGLPTHWPNYQRAKARLIAGDG